LCVFYMAEKTNPFFNINHNKYLKFYGFRGYLMGQDVFKTLGFVLLAFAVVFTGCNFDEVEKVIDAAKPAIVAQPQGRSIAKGTTHTANIVAVGNVLSYQWYSYTAPLQYERHLGDLLEGETGASFTTPVLQDEGIFSYYVIVTNTDNKATGRHEMSVQSDPVMVGVNDPDNAVYPIITKHPENVGGVIFRKNMDLPVLTVAATSYEDGEISYQWFVADELTNESGEEIPDATAADYRPIPPAPGDYYYFVKVTNTNFSAPGRRQSFSLSNPAYVQVIPNPNAEAPVIYSQPAGAIYFNGDTVRPITVDAEAEDGGVLSYQWQVSATSATADNFVDVTTGTGGTTASYTPVINTATASRNFYRVVITNTNNYATQNKTATATSKAADVVVTTPAADTFNLTLTIGNLTGNPTSVAARSSSPKNQFVRGFGAMDVAWGNFPNLSMDDVDNMYNPDMYNPDKLGYNVLRNMILPYDEDPVAMLQDFTRTPAGRYYYDTVRRVNQYGGYVLSSPWTPPAVWKTNNSTVGTGARLRDIYYRQYANYLRTFAQAMANNGAPIYTVSIQNEPNHDANYDGCNWSGNEMRDFFKQVGYFTRAGSTGSLGIDWPTNIPGYGGGRALESVMPMSGSSANDPAIHNAALNDPDAKKNLAIVARHPYGSRNNNLAGQPTSDGNHNATYNDDPREVWETEFNLNTVSNPALDSTWGYMWAVMNSVDMHIRNNHENVYIWWAGKRYYSMIGDGESGTRNGQILPRGRALSHWAKFAKETYHVSTTASGTLIPAAGGSVAISFEQNNGGNLNPKNYSELGATGSNHSGGANASTRAAKVTAFVKLKDKDYGTNRPGPDPFYVNLTAWNGNAADIEYISFVMFTPTDVDGANGFGMGDVKLVMPPNFKIRGAEAMRSTQPAGGTRDVFPVWETVGVSQDRNAAYVNLPRGQILSVRLFNE
jgi:O-glycosyl hydrolase